MSVLMYERWIPNKKLPLCSGLEKRPTPHANLRDVREPEILEQYHDIEATIVVEECRT
jgi:hypothetical protein